jgi:uncharacterized protein
VPPRSFEIPVDTSTTVSALLYPAAATPPLRTAVILAHGAGAPQSHPFMTHFAGGLAKRGADVMTFDFAYMERRRRAPDPAAKLEGCYRAVIEATRGEVESARATLVIGGKSMGGRIASQVVAADAEGLGVAGLVFLGYPLHPPGRPDRMRSGHLPSITAPMLFVQGTRDPLGTPDELRTVLDACRAARLHLVEGGDHSLKIKGKGAPPPEETYAAVQDVIADWLRSLRRG